MHYRGWITYSETTSTVHPKLGVPSTPFMQLMDVQKMPTIKRSASQSLI